MKLIEKEPVAFHGKSARKYNFWAYCLDTEFTECEAVYIFTKRTPRAKKSEYYNRLYVGETNNLATVIQNHVNSACLKQHGVDSICIRLNADESSRCKIVRYIIDGVGGRPPCNVSEKLWHDRAIVDALKNILNAYPYLEYDEDGSKHPSTDGADMLKVKITDSRKIKASVANQIAVELSKATGRKFMGTIPETRMNLFIGEGSKRTV